MVQRPEPRLIQTAAISVHVANPMPLKGKLERAEIHSRGHWRATVHQNAALSGNNEIIDIQNRFLKAIGNRVHKVHIILK